MPDALSWSTLPSALLLYAIAELLDPITLAMCSSVSKPLLKCALDERYWANATERQFGLRIPKADIPGSGISTRMLPTWKETYAIARQSRRYDHSVISVRNELTAKIVSRVRIDLLLLGANGVGKTSLINRFVTGMFDAATPTTTRTSVHSVQFHLGNDVAVDMSIVDETRSDRRLYSSAHSWTYQTPKPARHRMAAVIYAVDDRQSFHDATDFINECDDFAMTIAVANKSDRYETAPASSLVSDEECARLCDQNRTVLIHTSARTGRNVDDLFHFIAILFLARQQPVHTPSNRQANTATATGLHSNDITLRFAPSLTTRV